MQPIVAINDVPFVASIIRKFGLPTPQNSEVDELIGPYPTKDGDKYLKYCAKDGSWTIRGEGFARVACIILDAETPSDDYEDAQKSVQAMEALGWDWRGEAPGEPFIIGKWKMKWTYVRKLKRWEIAFLGKA